MQFISVPKLGGEHIMRLNWFWTFLFLWLQTNIVRSRFALLGN